MRLGLIVGAIALVAIVIAAGLGFSVSVGPVFSVCSHNSEIPAPEHADIVAAGQEFMTLVRSGDADAVRNAMSREAQEGTELPLVEQAIQSAAALSGGDIALKDVFKLYVPLGSREGMSICGPPSRPAMVARHGGSHSALATFEEPLDGAVRTWTLYFEHDVGAWRVRHFHFGLSAIGGRDGEAFRNLARAQASAGHAFNATVLYDVAAMLLSRGESFQPAEAHGLAQERAALQRHADLALQPPFSFSLGGTDFVVSRLNVTGVRDQKLVLMLEQRGERPVDQAEAIVRNRLLIDAMNAHRAEWRDAFDALAASYPTGVDTVWRTVYAREEGYLPEPALDDEPTPSSP